MNEIHRCIHITVLTLLASSFSQSLLSQGLTTLEVSDFDDPSIGTDGWRGTNSANAVNPQQYLTYSPTNGYTLGYISVGETSGGNGTLYFAAPDKFLGDKRAAYNGLLTFVHRQDASTQLGGGGDFVLLGSSNVVLSFSLRNTPTRMWTLHKIPLNENAGWINVTSNRFATKEDLILVMSSITRLWIKAEFSTENADQSDLDHVQLLGQQSGPLQPTLAAATFAGITIDGAVGSSYRVEYRNAFAAEENWEKLADVVLPVSPYLFIDHSSSNASHRFYRAVLNE